MDPTIAVNTRVDVVVVYRKTQSDTSPMVMPHRMRYKGQDIIFSKLGLLHPTVQGKRMVHVFDVSDGVNDYRLEHDAERLTWTLIAMIPGVA